MLDEQQRSDLLGSEPVDLALDVYVYGYSLVTTEVTRRQMTNVAVPDLAHAPLNSFLSVPRYPPADYRGVSAPNADTLYSVAWIDVGDEPQVFSHPDMGDRYYMFPMYSMWMVGFYQAGARVSGGRATEYLLTPPDWRGTVPDGLVQVPSPTRYLVILGRTYADGTEQDYEAVNALQAQLKVTPLSSWGKSFTYTAPPVDEDPPFSMTDAPQKVIADLGAEGYFQLLVQLMSGVAPPAAADAAMLAKMAQIGIEPGKPFELTKLQQPVRALLGDLPQRALKKLEDNRGILGESVNGWVVGKGLGRYGTDYLKRAVVAAYGWPANVEEDAVYPYTFVDNTGAPLDGTHKYALTFEKDRLPPVNGYWSITMYMVEDGWWFYPNRLNKLTASLRDNPSYDQDGALTLYFQHESPGVDKEANWLPAPTGAFLLMLRMYWPKPDPPSILDGTWEPPAIQRVG